MAIIENKKGDFKAHDEGTFIAVLRDAYIHERPNPFKGMARDKADPSKGVDERDTIQELVMEFLTDSLVDVGGKMLPGFVRYTATPSVNENSNLRKFVQAWFPQLKPSDFDRFDTEKLIGKGAYITVKHNVSKKGSVFANVVGAMQPPKGSKLPEIPADFVRHDARPVAPPPTMADEPKSELSSEKTPAPEFDDLPF